MVLIPIVASSTSNPAGRSSEDRLSDLPQSSGKADRSRRHSQGRDDEYLRLRPAHGPRPHHGAAGMVLGHEITGEVIEKGRDVEYLEIGDLVSVPFNVACGRCRTCREGDTGVCLHVNHDRAGGAYGYVDMGGWIGGQADYVMVPSPILIC